MNAARIPQRGSSSIAAGIATVFVNPERCIGCRQCEFACAVEHSRSRDPAQAVLENPPPRTRIHVEPGYALNSSFPNRCRHCNPAPCQQVCPTAAISRDSRQDLVLVDPAKCIACAMCAMVCPFDVITFHALSDGALPRVVAVKCDGCIERVRRGQIPACAEACKDGALVYGELNDLVRQGRLRETHAVLAAIAEVETEAPAAPGTVAGWRQWGAEAKRIAGGVR
jgi:anaerobic carbon-monoxide dehydrogenase iron sulfur subunit